MLEIGLFFPTAIGFQRNILNSEEIISITNKTYNIKNMIESNGSSWLSENNSPYNTFGKYSILKDEDFGTLVESVNSSVRSFADFHNDSSLYTPSESWINIYQKNNFQEPHSHSYPCMYSAVYYLKAPKDSGKIVFIPPFTQYVNEQFLTDENPVNDTYRYIVPEDNMLVIFKSYLQHYVLPGNSEEDRISIPFNYVIDPNQYIKIFND